MIELTTSIAFLVSSMYGAGTTSAALATTTNAAATSTTLAMATTTESVSIDRAAVQEYLKTQFADTPILVAIAQCESGFRQFNPDGTVVRGKVDNHDVGVM